MPDITTSGSLLLCRLLDVVSVSSLNILRHPTYKMHKIESLLFYLHPSCPLYRVLLCLPDALLLRSPQSRTQSPQAFWSADGLHPGESKNLNFLIGCPVTVCIVLPQKSCGNKIPVPQSLSWRPTASQRAWGLWVRDWVVAVGSGCNTLWVRLYLNWRLSIRATRGLSRVSSFIQLIHWHHHMKGVVLFSWIIPKLWPWNMPQINTIVSDFETASPKTI